MKDTLIIVTTRIFSQCIFLCLVSNKVLIDLPVLMLGLYLLLSPPKNQFCDEKAWEQSSQISFYILKI